jgi:hypothetical protein
VITQGWFIEKVLNKTVVPTCPQSPKTDWGQNENTETRMNKGLQESVPNVPIVPTKKESPCVLVGNSKDQDLEKIREWLFRIGEPENEHNLVLDRCRNDPQALEYYLKHTQGEFDNAKPALAGNDPPNVESISKDEAVRIIGNWMIAGGRPPADYLFRLIVEKCENDPAARAHFLREALASEARRQSVINEKVVSLADHDDRRKCADCAFLDRSGYCQQWKKSNPHNPRYRPVQDVLRRCLVFKAKEDR